MKPKILFLHGSGTNPLIFRIQSRALVSLLTPHFEVVFLSGFHACPPGPGVLPFFEGADPYLKWLEDSTPQEEKVHWAELDRLVREAEEKGPFVGVVGFSQGAKAGMELGGKDTEREGGYKESLGLGKVARTESFHLIGEDDPWRGESEALVGFFDEGRRRVRRFKGGHQMPLDKGVNQEVVEWILGVCQL
ncbi:serine hydrolase-domain-containing protein [Apiosordaria backusii]|uniref:Serine hydrolase-domain-containing protein n=1 Tax=Apiosordaria backusii TaxID=314023 RepID=A0AA40BMZ8_9PEZI|nr:serine hydrolase-domain-containing protein [Apiosordaria backusii]